MKCKEKDCVLYKMQDNWRCVECLKEKSRVWYKPSNSSNRSKDINVKEK